MSELKKGYYWVFYNNHWEIAEWNTIYFYLPGDILGHDAEEFEQIDPTPITRTNTKEEPFY